MKTMLQEQPQDRMGAKSSPSLSFLSTSSLPRAEGALLLHAPVPESPVWSTCSTCHLKERERERKPPGNPTGPLIRLRTCLQQHVKQKHKQKKLWGLPLWGQTCWFHPGSGTWKLCPLGQHELPLWVSGGGWFGQRSPGQDKTRMPGTW